MTPRETYITKLLKRVDAGDVFYIPKGAVRWEVRKVGRVYQLKGTATNGKNETLSIHTKLLGLQVEMRRLGSLQNWREDGEV